MTLSQSTVLGGGTLTGTVTLNGPAPAGGALIPLSGSLEGEVVVPQSVTVPAGSLTSVQIDATLGGVTKTVFLNVAPNPDDEPLLESVTITPISVPGGTDATGTVHRSAPSPAGGIFITLATGNSSVAQVPAVVAVRQGQTSADFTVTTLPVSHTTVVAITAFYGSGVGSANLTVTK